VLWAYPEDQVRRVPAEQLRDRQPIACLPGEADGPRQYLDICDVAGGSVLIAVAGIATYFDGTVLAELPVRDDARRNFGMTINALQTSLLCNRRA
jgi:hypothetical protein